MITLPNGKSIDLDMLETAMEDSDLAHRYFLESDHRRSGLLFRPSRPVRRG